MERNSSKADIFLASSFLYLKSITTMMQWISNFRGKNGGALKLPPPALGNHLAKFCLLPLSNQFAEFSPLPQKTNQSPWWNIFLPQDQAYEPVFPVSQGKS